MNQDFETQLQVVERALGEVVLPALGDAEKHVIEQLQLSLAAVGFMRQRLPHARRYYRGTLMTYLDMAAEIIDLLGSGPIELAALSVSSRDVLFDAASTDNDLRHATGVWRAEIAAIIEGTRDAGHASELGRIVMNYSEPMLLLDRAWCVPLGFELRPQDFNGVFWD